MTQKAKEVQDNAEAIADTGDGSDDEGDGHGGNGTGDDLLDSANEAVAACERIKKEMEHAQAAIKD
jgi:hypothetical protein